MEQKYYHVTRLETYEKILLEGLKCNNEGNIFVFENKAVKQIIGNEEFIIKAADHIALNQVFIKGKCVMLEIDSKGITGKILPDNVAESTAKLQWIIKQKIIEPKHINFFAIFKPVDAMKGFINRLIKEGKVEWKGPGPAPWETNKKSKKAK